ncbi:hypothetical protein ES332_A05G096000v1 [Gossypium tomentosum]|uniref:Uncharacterized protein n=1 Tax=Gossypium tomentosum TaxID=34277 RepID=A0A5D2QG47_GOSTO|nr:hypothetical protein ES332_A05G096000v1 [Gossypium tomentosum]
MPTSQFSKLNISMNLTSSKQSSPHRITRKYWHFLNDFNSFFQKACTTKYINHLRIVLDTRPNPVNWFHLIEKGFSLLHQPRMAASTQHISKGHRIGLDHSFLHPREQIYCISPLSMHRQTCNHGTPDKHIPPIHRIEYIKCLLYISAFGIHINERGCKMTIELNPLLCDIGMDTLTCFHCS